MRFASPEWIQALDAAVSDQDALAEATAGIHLVVEQRITTDQPVVYHLTIDDGRVSFTLGPAERADLSFSQDAATAAAISSGETSAQAAFMEGRLQIGGDLRHLTDDLVSRALHDVFAAVRAAVTVESVPLDGSAGDDARTA